MTQTFFEKPILNLPYAYSAHHSESDESGQPTNRIIDARDRGEFITSIPTPKKRQMKFARDEGEDPSDEKQQYAMIANELRACVDRRLGQTEDVTRNRSSKRSVFAARRETTG
jgi:type III restriction enzyme